MRSILLASLLTAACGTETIVATQTTQAALDAGTPPPAVDAGAPTPKKGAPYPIVLCHGFFGFEEFAGIDYVKYFFGVKEELSKNGEVFVFTPTVDPFNDSSFRGKQLIARIEEILKQTGHKKVNLVGHSQGGLDVRVVAHDRPDLIASVVTIGAPHQGVPIADFASGVLKNETASNALDEVVRLVGAPLWDTISKQSAISKALTLFSKEGIARFNAAYPNNPSVLYFSVTGRTALHDGDPDCKTPNAPEFVREYDGALDTTNPLLKAAELFVAGDPLHPEPNDGFVTVKSAKLGTFLGCVPADHLDEVGQIVGEFPGTVGKRFDHKKFYVGLVKYLRSLGL